ncbi:MAG: tryptophan synthase subunit alpha [Euryarchaeota archaeon]
MNLKKEKQPPEEINSSEKLETYDEMFKRLKKNKKGAFVPFIVAGDPDFETSLDIVKTLLESGADALEIGFAFSDPVADGPTIQESDLRALASGMNTQKSFEFIKRIREFTSIPIGLLVYYNLIYKKGVDEFYKEAKKCGVTSILSADLPPEEAEEALQAAKKYNINQIFLVAPTTQKNRLDKICQIASGFIYLVSVMGVTGARKKVQNSTVELIKRIRNSSDLPVMVGFGISKPSHVKDVIQAGAQGAIVGSAIIEIISKNLDKPGVMLSEIKKDISKMNEATQGSD